MNNLMQKKSFGFKKNLLFNKQKGGMMGGKNIISIVIFSFLLVLGAPYAVSGQEKADNWLSSLLEMVRPNPKNNDDERLRRVIYNINKHQEELEARISGYDEFYIQQQFKAKQTASGYGSISGRVRLKGEESKYPPTIYVSAYNEFGYHSGIAYIYSASSGHYSITELVPGKYYLRASAYGYDSKYYRKASDWKKAKLIYIRKGKNTGGKNFVLKSKKGKGVISGQIKGQDGTPLSDCYIYAYGENYSYQSSASTDENGMYKIEGLKSGRYRLLCTYYGSRSFISEWYDDEQSYESSTEVKVSEPKTTSEINFTLDFGGTIKGKVICASGNIAGPYQYGVLAYDKEQNIVSSGHSNEEAKFTIPNLKKGKYRLYISYNGPENNLNGWYKNAEDFKHATKIQINPHKTKNVRIKLKPGGAISGKVTDYAGQPIAHNCYINIYNERGEYVSYAYTDTNGDYLAQRLPTGRYKIFTEYNDYYSSFSSEPIDEWYDSSYEFKDAAFVKVKAPQTTPNINFSLDQGGSIAGRVYCAEGYPAYPDGSVRVYDSKGNYIGYCDVRYDGEFFISGLRSGHYELLAQNEDYKSEWYNRKQSLESADTVWVSAPHVTTDIDFTLEYPGIIQGFVNDDKGHRLLEEEYLIGLYAYDSTTGEFETSGFNSFTGGYQVRLLNGNYKLAAVSMYSNWQPEQDSLAATFYPSGKSFYDPSNKAINLTADSVRNLNPLVMKKANGTISGTLYDKNTSFPLEDASYLLFAFDDDGYLVKVSAYGSEPVTGEYKLMGLRPGNYYVLAMLFSDNPTHFWYDGASSYISNEIISPKVEIPANASAVFVGAGDTQGIDLYIKK